MLTLSDGPNSSSRPSSLPLAVEIDSGFGGLGRDPARGAGPPGDGVGAAQEELRILKRAATHADRIRYGGGRGCRRGRG